MATNLETKIGRIRNNVTAALAKIAEKGVTVPEGAGSDDLETLIDAITGGGATTPSSGQNDVNFIDYDGTILYSYTLEEAQALTELPGFPSRDGLVCQGWNWTLDAIKALGRAVTVGASYITDDGATRLHIRIATEGRMTVPLYFGQTAENGVSIDWGDGGEAETLEGTGSVNTSHIYAEPGDYTISLMPEDGCTLSLGNGTSSYCVLGSTANAGKVYINMLQEVHIGKNVTTISDSAFYGCSSLASITIPDGATTISDSAFYGCFSLASITIPEGVTSIGSYAFYYCYGMRYYDFTACTSVPALSSTNAFNKIPSDCQMLIPAALYDEWSAATNWATYASYMVAV